jgi:FtsP/CotA-like multicopper oxidase with cupredoxin domain
MRPLRLKRAAALTLRAAGLALLLSAPLVAQQGPPFANPPSVKSVNGRLSVTLNAGPATVTVAGVPFAGNVYNGLYAPPVLRVNRGDVINLQLVNNVRLPTPPTQVTNLHYHGFAVSPLSPSDNIFIAIQPGGGVYNYTVQMPPDHAQGMFWYHPHPHGISEAQVLSGLSGGMIVEGLLENYYPEFVGVTERIMLFKDADLSLPNTSPCYAGTSGGETVKIKTVNGLCNPTVPIRPNEVQFWRMGNIGADAYFNLKLPAGMSMYVIAVDGNATSDLLPVNSFLLPPGARVEALVVGPTPGTYPVTSFQYDTGPDGDPNPTVPLVSLVSSGTPARDAAPARGLRRRAARGRREPPTAAQVRAYPVTRTRQFTFDENTQENTFCINNCQYDMNRVDTEVTVGDVEEWTILNTTGEVHAFHIHQLDFLVTEINGVPQNPTGVQDTVNLPYKNQSTGRAGEVKIKLAFTNPNIAGKFVYHCHILEHEDGGMMANIIVWPQQARARRVMERRLREDARARGHAHAARTAAAQPCIPCVLLKR